MRLFLFFILLGIVGTNVCSSAQVISLPSNVCGYSKTISSIKIEGNKKTKSNIILRELSIKLGDTVSDSSLENLLLLNYQRLYNLNIFTDIQIAAAIENDGLSIIIRLKEQWFIIPQADVELADRNINVWWNEQNHDLSRINLGMYVQHKNLSGHLDKLSIRTHVGYTQQFTASFFRPYIDKRLKQGIGLDIGYSRSKEIAYNTSFNKLQFIRHQNNFLYNNFFASASWLYRDAYHSRHIISLGYHQYIVNDTINKLNPFFFESSSSKLNFAELSYRYEYNGVDNWNYPRSGLKFIGNLSSRWGFNGMKYQALAAVELGFFQRLNQHLLSSFVLRARTAFTDQQAYFLQTALGYKTNFVRGYEYYVIEANHFAIGRLSLKYEALHKQFNHLPFKYLPKIPLWIYPKIFIDAGYAANNNASTSNNLSNKLLYSCGLGVDIITAYDLKLRIEFAYNHLGENGLYLHSNSE